MNKEFPRIADLLAHLNTPAGKVTEGYHKVGNVSPDLAMKVLTITGLDVIDFTVVLDRSGILHTFKQHGASNAASEITKGQIPIGNIDFEELSEWLMTPSVILPGQSRPGQPCIEFQCVRPTGNACVILEYRKGRRRLVLATMYKKRPTA